MRLRRFAKSNVVSSHWKDLTCRNSPRWADHTLTLVSKVFRFAQRSSHGPTVALIASSDSAVTTTMETCLFVNKLY